jgi:hypothetical protein
MTTVSADSRVDAEAGAAHHMIRLTGSGDQRRALAARLLVPGMPAAASRRGRGLSARPSAAIRALRHRPQEQAQAIDQAHLGREPEQPFGPGG